MSSKKYIQDSCIRVLQLIQFFKLQDIKVELRAGCSCNFGSSEYCRNASCSLAAAEAYKLPEGAGQFLSLSGA